MSTELIDPWATPDPGFERYTGPDAADDGFDPMDSRGKDLADYRRAELAAHPQRTATHETVMLSDGRKGELMRQENGDWELRVHLGRDYYEITTAPTRDGVLGKSRPPMLGNSWSFVSVRKVLSGRRIAIREGTQSFHLVARSTATVALALPFADTMARPNRPHRHTTPTASFWF